MRILRGKSNLEVSSKGFALFVVGLVLATFIGGAVRTILSSNRVHQRIVSELKSRFPHNEFQIGKTEILLSRGFWPGLGLRLENVVFKQSLCGKLSFVLSVPEAVLPVDLLSLRLGRIRLGRVEVKDAKMHLDYQPCPNKESANHKSSEESGMRETLAQRGIRPLRLDWKSLSRNLEGLELTNLTMTYERNLTWKLVFVQAEVSLADEMYLQAQVDVQKSLPFGTLNHALNLEIQGKKESLLWNLNAEFKEGRINSKGNWDLKSNEASGNLQLNQLPLKDFTSELFQMGLVERDIKLKTAWLTCLGRWQGQMDKLELAPIQLKVCKLEGAYGRVELDQAEFFADGSENPFKQAAKLNVQKLQLQPVLESLGRQVLPAVVPRLGIWTGTVLYSGMKTWQLDGSLENAEIVFSNQSVRGKQLIRSVHTIAERANRGVQIHLDQIALQDGEYAGQMNLQLMDDWRTGSFNTEVERFSLSPSIQSLLIGGHMEPVKFKAQGQLDNGELAALSGVAQLTHMEGKGWSGSGLNFRAKYKPGTLTLDADVNEANVNSLWHHYAQLEILPQSQANSLNFRDLHMKLDIHHDGGAISSLRARQTLMTRDQVAPLVWQVHGAWVRDGALEGTLNISRAGMAQTYLLHGEKGLFSLKSPTKSESIN